MKRFELLPEIPMYMMIVAQGLAIPVGFVRNGWIGALLPIPFLAVFLLAMGRIPTESMRGRIARMKWSLFMFAFYNLVANLLFFKAH